MEDLPGDFSSRFRWNPRVDASRQLFGSFRIAQIVAPPLVERITDAGKLRHPLRHRNPGVSRVDEILNKDVRLARHLHRCVDERHDEDEPDRQREGEWCEDPLSVSCERANQAPIEWPEGDRQYRGPGERGEISMQDP